MKRFSGTYFLVFFLTLLTIAGCRQKNSIKNSSLQTTDGYFANPDTGVQNGGVKMVSISTPKGKFNVWTKRIGNNPAIKLLLLNGGPGATHAVRVFYQAFCASKAYS